MKAPRGEGNGEAGGHEGKGKEALRITKHKKEEGSPESESKDIQSHGTANGGDEETEEGKIPKGEWNAEAGGDEGKGKEALRMIKHKKERGPKGKGKGKNN